MEKSTQKITGYRDLTQEEIDLMNKIKHAGIELEKLLEDVRNTFPEPEDPTEFEEDRNGEYYEWWHEAKQSLKKGLMFLVRSVAKPTSF